MNALSKAIKVLIAYKDLIGSLKKGESRSVMCPLCGHPDMKISKSGYNGHLHIWCDGCEFLLVE